MRWSSPIVWRMETYDIPVYGDEETGYSPRPTGATSSLNGYDSSRHSGLEVVSQQEVEEPAANGSEESAE